MSIYLNIPRYADERNYDGIYDCSDNGTMLFWRNANDTMMASYTLQLEEMGYTKHQALNNNSIHSHTYYKDKLSVHVYLLKRTAELRVVIQDNAILPVNSYEYEELCKPAVTQLGLYDDSKVYTSMGYLIRLADGTFVVIDGGKGFDYNAELLYNTMLEQKPEGVDDIIISAWILTHEHGDHNGVLVNFMKNYNDKVTVKMLVGNDAPDLVYQSCFDGFVRHFDYSSVSGKFGGCVYMKTHTGQQFLFPGVTFTVLYTHEDMYPAMMEQFNDVSVVVDAVIKGEAAKSPVKEGETRFVWLADVHPDGAKRLIDMYGENMSCDVMQIAHHGIGCPHYDLYVLCNPRIAYWPCGKTVLEYKDGTRFNRPHIKFLVDTTEQMIYQAYGSHTFWFGEK